MSDDRQMTMTEDDFIDMMNIAGLPSAKNAGITGVSKTVVKAANGTLPRQSAYTVVYFCGDLSLSMLKYRELFIAAYNDYMIEAMKESAVPGSILLGSSFFTDANYHYSKAGDDDYQEPLHLFHAPMVLDQCPRLTMNDYDPDRWNSNTPLNDAIASQIAVGTVHAENAFQKGKSVTVILIWFTDGEENTSERIKSPEEIAPDLRRLMELGNFIPVLIGFSMSNDPNSWFANYARRAGFPVKNARAVPVGGNTEDARRELRRMLNMVSQRTVAASQGVVDNNDFFS